MSCSKTFFLVTLCTQTMLSVLVFMCRDPGDATSKVSCCVESSYCFKNSENEFDPKTKIKIHRNYAFTRRFDSYNFTEKAWPAFWQHKRDYRLKLHYTVLDLVGFLPQFERSGCGTKVEHEAKGWRTTPAWHNRVNDSWTIFGVCFSNRLTFFFITSIHHPIFNSWLIGNSLNLLCQVSH